MKKCFATTDVVEARQVLDYLIKNDVPAKLHNEQTATALTPDPAVQLEIHVPDDAMERTMKLLEEADLK